MHLMPFGKQSFNKVLPKVVDIPTGVENDSDFHKQGSG
jgi:hypothetical protein